MGWRAPLTMNRAPNGAPNAALGMQAQAPGTLRWSPGLSYLGSV